MLGKHSGVKHFRISHIISFNHHKNALSPIVQMNKWRLTEAMELAPGGGASRAELELELRSDLKPGALNRHRATCLRDLSP